MLDWKEGQNTVHMHVLPLQMMPSPVNPAIQEHSNPPLVFVQLAYSLQLFNCWSEHSSISAGNNYQPQILLLNF